MSKRTKTTKVAKATTTKVVEAPSTVTLANVCRELDPEVNPKAARSRFRKLYAEGKDISALPQLVTGAGSRWVFKSKDRGALETLIRAAK